MSKQRDSFIFYRDWKDALRKLSPKLRLEAYDAILDYALDGNASKVSELVSFAMDFIKPRIDHDRQRYLNICERNRNNSKNAGRKRNPNKIQNNPVDFVGLSTISVGNPNACDNDNKYDNDNEYDNDNDNDINRLESKDSLSVSTETEDKTNFVEIVSFYNNSVKDKNMPQCVKLTEKRRAAIKARLKEFGREKIFEAIQKCAESSFCNGCNDKNWRADIDFVFNANKMARILEGKYDNDRNGKTDNSNERTARSVGENALGNIFREIEERRGT